MLIDVDVLLMVEEGIREGICYAIHKYAEENIKYMKNYDQNKESTYSVFRCKQFVRMCNVSKITCRCF